MNCFGRACLLGSAICLSVLFQGALPSRADDSHATLPISGLKPDAGVPALRNVLGYAWAAQLTTHEGMERYLKALVAAAPDRTRLVKYGSSNENRALYYLVISSPENIKHLAAIRADSVRLAAARRLTPKDAKQIAKKSPAIVWLAYSVHGNETSTTDAALLTAYHLLADTRPETRKMLEQIVVIIDPLQNPDGRARFINVYRESRGLFPNANRWSTEHTERWPSGRFNHYLFDMNRDWFLHSQKETVFKVRAYLRWQPQIYVDAHEMGHNSAYFFTPPADPVNPFVLPKQRAWFMTLGRQQASWFDRFGFAYTSREMFDAFFPGYGTDWPTAQGAIGVLWEQAGVRGLVVDRDDDTQLTFHDAVLHHYISGLATLQIVAKRREQLLQDFYAVRMEHVKRGQTGPIQHFFLPTKSRPNRTRRLAELLQRNGIDVYRTKAALKIIGTDTRTGKRMRQTIPAGSFQIPVAQGTGGLIRLLLDRQVKMDAAYVERQLKRKQDHLPSEIYDVTAWSLPLAFDVPCLATGAAPLGKLLIPRKKTQRTANLARAKVAYVVQTGDGALEALGPWLRQHIRVHVADRSFSLADRTFPRGTLILKVAENGESLHDKVAQAASRYHLRVVAVDTGFVTKGAHFGGPYVKWVRPPRILLAMGRPAAPSAGHTWYLFDKVLRYPTTRVNCHDLAKVDLSDFNVIVLPHGNYTDPTALNPELGIRLKQWVRDGGTLILIKGATAWATCDKIGLLATRRVRQGCPPVDKAEATKQSPPVCAAFTDKPEQPFPDAVPGAFLLANAFDQHWLTFGCPATMRIFFKSNMVFEPLKPKEGRNVITFSSADRLVVSGFCWPETTALLANKPYLMYRALGKGHIVGFADDPNYRAMYPSLQRLFINAVLFGPGH